ncbi:hypothetical protein ACRE_064650 [Hapsidospora chrysogenum ATCC 11550]|uniref:Uncharacterized protein n=1 Tax=Hapsidospora chrysogenum (strain ATCC 11550 / CBS 779.69 / DSM 880 / IAM 14645 / JCM 23072 / IMI 49137) TaxID=857340 RepID=A0A086T0C4_HAPC1|nr:hypothetical protein ACRE_064650 [Hapsidospora chrysogenum ATCC 11550]
MGLNVSEAPSHEAFADKPLVPIPCLEYYPSMGDQAITTPPVVKLSVLYRNHVAFNGSSDDIIQGDLRITGKQMPDGIGWRFTLDNVCFTQGAVGAVWSIKACMYLGDKFRDDTILTGIAVEMQHEVDEDSVTGSWELF